MRSVIKPIICPQYMFLANQKSKRFKSGFFYILWCYGNDNPFLEKIILLIIVKKVNCT